MFKISIFLILLCSISSALSITSELELKQKYPHEINSFYKTAKSGYFKGEKNLNIFFKYFKLKDEKGSIVISNGRTESILKYKELIYDLTQNGYSVFILDHRGQGVSDRITASKPRLGDIDNFDYYVEDLHTFVKNIVKPTDPKKLFLLSHSMGGAIAALYLNKYKNDFDAAVLSSPMIEPKMILPSTSTLICKIITNFTIPQKKAIESNEKYKKSAVEKESLTHSSIRFNIYKNEMQQHPQNIIYSPSWFWVDETCRVTKKLLEEKFSYTKDILLLQSGDDSIVNLKPQEKFCNRLQNCKLIKIDGARHELFIEKDIYRFPALSNIIAFFNAH